MRIEEAARAVLKAATATRPLATLKQANADLTPSRVRARVNGMVTVRVDRITVTVTATATVAVTVAVAVTVKIGVGLGVGLGAGSRVGLVLGLVLIMIHSHPASDPDM